MPVFVTERTLKGIPMDQNLPPRRSARSRPRQTFTKRRTADPVPALDVRARQRALLVPLRSAGRGHGRGAQHDREDPVRPGSSGARPQSLTG